MISYRNKLTGSFSWNEKDPTVMLFSQKFKIIFIDNSVELYGNNDQISDCHGFYANTNIVYINFVTADIMPIIKNIVF